jgi:serine/threonine-protein phosphatase 2B regulatory subunit
MGQNHSFTGDELSELQKGNSLTQAQIMKLHKRFKKLDTDGSGDIDRNEFKAIPSLASNPLIDRVLSIFDADGNGTVSFQEFVRALSIFSPDTPTENKQRFLFALYDADNDGKISNRDLYRVLQIMVGSNLSDTQLQQIVDKTFIEADLNRDGYLDFAEFQKILGHSDVGEKLNLNM